MVAVKLSNLKALLRSRWPLACCLLESWCEKLLLGCSGAGVNAAPLKNRMSGILTRQRLTIHGVMEPTAVLMLHGCQPTVDVLTREDLGSPTKCHSDTHVHYGYKRVISLTTALCLRTEP